MPSDVAILEASDQSLLVTFGNTIEAENHARVLALFHSFRNLPVRGLMNLHPAYNSLLIHFNALQLTHGALSAIVWERLSSHDRDHEFKPKKVRIPVCYEGEFAPDLTELARLHRLSEHDVIDLHVSLDYTVYFVGFVPGFAYLGMVPDQIATPRLPAPRQKVHPGSVGIADRQTGVYPKATPGGWRLIGRTPLPIGFNFLEPGDQVRFEPISRDEFDAYVPV